MKIKSFIAAILLVTGILSAQAQEKKMWIGGTVGVWSSKVKDATDGTLSYKFEPEFGYSFNEHMAVGLSIGFMHSENSAISEIGSLSTNDREGDGFTISPFFRYSFLEGSFGYLFVDAGLAYTRIKLSSSGSKYSLLQIGGIPGVGIKVTERFHVLGQLGYFGYQLYKQGETKVNMFGLDVDWDEFQLAFIFKF